MGKTSNSNRIMYILLKWLCKQLTGPFDQESLKSGSEECNLQRRAQFFGETWNSDARLSFDSFNDHNYIGRVSHTYYFIKKSLKNHWCTKHFNITMHSNFKWNWLSEGFVRFKKWRKDAIIPQKKVKTAISIVRYSC